LVLEFLEECFFFERALVQLREGVAGPDDQINPVAREEEEKDEEHSDGLEDGVPGALADVAIGPEDECDPDGCQVHEQQGKHVADGCFPGAPGP